jgi:hypothetical protein
MTPAPISPFAAHLSLTCIKCTKGATFRGQRREEAVKAAVAAGWSMPVEQQFHCPRCSRISGTGPKREMQLISKDEALDAIFGGPEEFKEAVREAVEQVLGTTPRDAA